MSSGKCSLSLVTVFFFLFLSWALTPPFWMGKICISLRSDGNSVHEVSFVHLILHVGDIPTASPSHFSSGHQGVLHWIYCSLWNLTNIHHLWVHRTKIRSFLAQNGSFSKLKSKVQLLHFSAVESTKTFRGTRNPRPLLSHLCFWSFSTCD